MAAFFGDPGIRNNSMGDELESLMPIFNRVKNRELQDYEAKGRINQNLAIRQERIRSMMDPATGMGRTTNPTVSMGITPANPEVNTVMHNQLTPQEQMEFGLKKRGLELDERRAKTQEKLGEEKLNISQQQADLNRQKSEQIYGVKMADMQRKSDEAEQRRVLAEKKLEQHANDATALKEYHDAQIAAANARHELSIAQRDRQLEDTKKLHDAQIADLHAKIEELKNPKKTTKITEINPEGTKRTETTTKEKNPSFSSSTTKKFISKDNPQGWNIPMDKIDDFKKAHPDAQEAK